MDDKKSPKDLLAGLNMNALCDLEPEALKLAATKLSKANADDQVAILEAILKTIISMSYHEGFNRCARVDDIEDNEMSCG